MSSCKINNKLKYVIHDNYNRPFIVYIIGNNVMIYKQPASGVLRKLPISGKKTVVELNSDAQRDDQRDARRQSRFITL